MDYKKQKLLLEYLISSPEVFILCMPIIKPKYFIVDLRATTTFICNYFEQYHALPSPSQIEAETNIPLRQHDVTKDRIQYCTNEIEKFCKRAAVEDAIRTSVPLLDTQEYGTIQTKIKDAILVGLHRDLGLKYFDDPDARIQRMLQQPDLIPTGWSGIDAALYGGIGRKEITFFSGNSGTGKSLTLGNLCLNAVQKRYNCLYITNELSEDIIAQRFDTMVTGIGRAEWKYKVRDISTRLKAVQDDIGQIDIVYLPFGTTVNDVRSYLKEFELMYKYIPDIIAIDYLDRMKPTEHVPAGNTFENDKLLTIEARTLGIEYNAAIVTVSQLNRESVTVTQHHEGHIAGGISKFNESDNWISILGNMTIRGEAVYDFLKTRNSDGVGKKIRLEYVPKYLRIQDPEQNSPMTRFTQQTKTKGDLTQLMAK